MTLENGSLAGGPKQAGHARGRPPGRASAAATRTRIVRSAGEVFSQRGYHSASMQEVADRAGVSRPLVSFYFPGRRRLYRATTKATYLDVLLPAIGRAVEEKTLRRQLAAFLDVAGSAGASDQSAAAFLFTSIVECQARPELRDPEYDPLSTIRQFLTWAVSGAVERGELGADTAVGPLVELLFATLWGVGLYAGFIGTQRQAEAVTSAICRLWAGHLWALTELT
jgi:AcrR family transcriptional regulator